MERKLFGEVVLQKSKSEFFSATDLVTAGNRWRNAERQGVFSLYAWLKTKSTVEFIEELEGTYKCQVLQAEPYECLEGALDAVLGTGSNTSGI